MAHTFNLSTQKQAGWFLSSSQLGQNSEFQDSQGYVERPWLKTQKKKVGGGRKEEEEEECYNSALEIL